MRVCAVSTCGFAPCRKATCLQDAWLSLTWVPAVHSPQGSSTVRLQPDLRIRPLGHDLGRIDVGVYDVVLRLDLLEVLNLAE